MWSLRNIYFYLVCFVSIILIIGGLIRTVHSINELLFPVNYYETRIFYGQYEKKNGISKEEFISQREKEIEMQKQRELNRKIRNVINSLSMVIIALPFYIYHWRKIEQAQSLE